MAKRRGRVYVVTTKRAYKGKVYHCHLLRRSFREGGKVKNETLANLSHLPEHIVELVRRSLRGECFVSAQDAFEIVEGGSRAHGHVQAVLTAMERLRLPALIASRRSRQRDLVVAMIAARVLEPQSKLATTRWWSNTTLPDLLGVGDADEDELYAAMDWLLERQGRIERKLARRHLQAGGLALYDLTSSYFEGTKCPLAARGHNRDGKKGKLQVNYGLLTNAEGVPVAVSVFNGSVSDPNTLLPQVNKVRNEFGIERFVLVGDRGMLTHKQIDAMRDVDGVDWISALRPEAIRKLVEGEVIQMGLFDERNLFEIQHPDYPGERLVACRNPELAKRRAAKRKSLLEATERELAKVKRMVQRGRLRKKDRIGVRVGKVVNKYKVAKHFVLEIDDDHFDFHIDEAKVAAEAALDGIYVIRTSVPKQQMDTATTVRNYKLLSRVERAFRSMKTVDLMVRPIYHRLDKRVRAHIFLCMLAYYVLWHLIEAWRPLLFADEDQDAKRTRDPIAAATRSERARRKASTKRLDDGSTVHSVHTLLHHLAAIVRNTVRCPTGGSEAPTFDIDTSPDATQRRALELVKRISV